MKALRKIQMWLAPIVFVLACGAAASSAQTSDAATSEASVPTPVTLWMRWQRGNNARYGENFVYLHVPCQQSQPCECSMSFKATNSQEFADYISSFGESKVPVVYEVLYAADGRPRTERLLRIGTWTSDRFAQNDRLIGVSVGFQGNAVGKRQSLKLHGAEDCFPQLK